MHKSNLAEPKRRKKKEENPIFNELENMQKEKEETSKSPLRRM